MDCFVASLLAMTEGMQLTKHWAAQLDDYAIDLAWSPDGTLLAAASAAGPVSLFAAADGAKQHQLPGHENGTNALAWIPMQPAVGDSGQAPLSILATGGQGGGVILWDADDFVAQKEFPYGNGIHALVWSPDSKWLVSGNQDPSVHLWIPEQDIELHMSGYETKVKFLSFDHTSRWLATSGGRDACIWDCLGAGPEGRDPAMLPHAAPVCAGALQNPHGLLAT